MTSENLSQGLQSFAIPGGNYGYNGMAIDELTSFENTLAFTLFDESGSTRPFSRQMELCVKEIIGFLRKSPRADNLIYYHAHFDTVFKEVHGWKPLQQCNPDDYDGCWAGGGRTTLYDSLDRSVNVILDYAVQQAAQRYLCNGILIAMTDGMDWGSTLGVQDCQKTFAKAVMNEDLESLLSIWIGINDDPGVQDDMQRVANEIGFSQYMPVEKADSKSLAAIANFISRSVQAQSQSLGSKGPSQPQSMTF
jgi:hypothetical protein